MCGRHYSRVNRGAEAAPVEAGRAPSAEWMARAECRKHDPEKFFPVGTAGPARSQAAEAKAICRGCPVVDACLAWAIETGQDGGIWGARTEEERRALKRRDTTHELATAGSNR